MFNSFNNPTNQVILVATASRLLYSTSELRLTAYCFFDFQDNKESPSLITYPVIDFLVLGHAAQSESQKAES